MFRCLTLSLLIVIGTSLDADVVIVGAGTSGLVAAKTLVEKNPQLKIHVLEQRDRVGGRTKNLDVPGYPGVIMEVGGTWVGPTQDEVLDLCKELDLELYHTYYKFPGYDVHTTQPQMYPAPSNDTWQFVQKFETMAKDVGTEAPWAYEKAAEYDMVTLGEVLKKQGASDKVINEFNEIVLPMYNCKAQEMSFLFYLFLAASCPAAYDIGNSGGAQDYRLVKGSQQISVELLNRVTKAGVQVHFSTNVSHVTNAADGVTIMTNKGEFRAQHAIIALGTGDATRLSYEGLTPERKFLHDHWIGGGAMKFFFVFETAFWREGDFVPNFPAEDGFFYDYTPFNRTSPGVIAGFWPNSTEGFTRAVLEPLLIDALGHRVIGNVKAYHEEYWDLRHEGGTMNVVQHMAPGVLSKAGAAWRSPIGRLHWAGSDTAQKWMGYISGAVETGKRTANEVLTAYGQVVV